MHDWRNDGESIGGTQRTGRIVEEKNCLEMSPRPSFLYSADFFCDFNPNTSKWQGFDLEIKTLEKSNPWVITANFEYQKDPNFVAVVLLPPFFQQS